MIDTTLAQLPKHTALAHTSPISYKYYYNTILSSMGLYQACILCELVGKVQPFTVQSLKLSCFEPS